MSADAHGTSVGTRLTHPVVVAFREMRERNLQMRVADAVTSFAGSMMFVYIHAVVFLAWMILAESTPWPTLTLVVSLEAIFLSTFVLIGQNRQSAFQLAKADHDFVQQDLKLQTNTDLTRAIHVMTTELHRRATAAETRPTDVAPTPAPGAHHGHEPRDTPA